jgi:hypothetical protein
MTYVYVQERKPRVWTTLPGILTGACSADQVRWQVFTLVMTGDGSSSNDRGTTRVKWVRQMNAICAQGYAEGGRRTALAPERAVRGCYALTVRAGNAQAGRWQWLTSGPA